MWKTEPWPPQMRSSFTINVAFKGCIVLMNKYLPAAVYVACIWYLLRIKKEKFENGRWKTYSRRDIDVELRANASHAMQSSMRQTCCYFWDLKEYFTQNWVIVVFQTHVTSFLKKTYLSNRDWDCQASKRLQKYHKIYHKCDLFNLDTIFWLKWAVSGLWVS